VVPVGRSKKKTVVDDLVDAIRRELVSGELTPGKRIDQDEWAQRMEVSRTPVRLALERLEAEGFVTVVPQRGAVVNELTVVDLEDVLANRLVLEAALARAGARNLSDTDLHTLAAILEEIAALRLPEEHAQLLEPAHRFNICLYEAAGATRMNRYAMQLIDQTHVFLNRIWHANRRIAQVTQRYFAELYKACERRDLDRVERLLRDQRIDTAGVILQDRVRTDELLIFPGILTPAELDRLRAIIDDGHEPVGPVVSSAVAASAS
jgi:DNA-binding GntR family transcriptional regulator